MGGKRRSTCFVGHTVTGQLPHPLPLGEGRAAARGGVGKAPMRIYELPPPLFPRAAPLFAEAWMDGAFIGAVFEGKTPGRVFVDDAERPTAALMCRTYEYFVAGNPGATALRAFIRYAP